MVTAVGSSTLGIVVDRVFDTEEIVVKPVAPMLRHVTMFSGNTILGDGSVIMILDPNGVARSAGVCRQARHAEQSAVADAGHARATAGTCCCSAAGEAAARRAAEPGRPSGSHSPRTDRAHAAGSVTQYRGKLMPLIRWAADADRAREADAAGAGVREGERTMGLMVDEIIDVVHGQLTSSWPTPVPACWAPR